MCSWGWGGGGGGASPAKVSFRKTSPTKVLFSKGFSSQSVLVVEKKPSLAELFVWKDFTVKVFFWKDFSIHRVFWKDFSSQSVLLERLQQPKCTFGKTNSQRGFF